MKNTFRKLAFGLGLAIASITAHADVVTPLVSLQENVINDADGNWLMNQYVVTNNSGDKNDHIYAFGVTNPAEMSVWTTRSGWAAITMSKNEWNSGQLFNITYSEGIYFTLKTGAAFLGSFESLFGSEDSYVNFYWLQDAVIGGVFSIGETDDEFYFSAPVASQYAAFSQYGTTFQSFNNAPEPGSLALLGLAALAGLAVTRRRRSF